MNSSKYDRIISEVVAMKLVMFDLDGTLLSYIHGISEGNREAFRKLHHLGYHLGIATGRRVSNVEELLGDDVKYFDVLIGENGYQTKDLKANQNTYTRKLTQEEMQEIIDEFNDESIDITFCHFNDVGTYFYRESSFAKRSEEEFGRNVFYTNGVLFEPLPKMCMPVAEALADEYRARVEAIKGRSYHGAMTGKGFFEFMSTETTKWHALEKYMAKNNFVKEDVIAFGDSGNDMEILSNVGFAVAMKNADDKVKEICHDVTKYTNDEDGVGRYILEQLLKAL